MRYGERCSPAPRHELFVGPAVRVGCTWIGQVTARDVYGAAQLPFNCALGIKSAIPDRNPSRFALQQNGSPSLLGRSMSSNVLRFPTPREPTVRAAKGCPPPFTRDRLTRPRRPAAEGRDAEKAC
jgi:hypothetical protein